jgi:Spy/CpxP family protein refolding chaperone
MKIKFFCWLALVVASAAAFAQESPAPNPGGPGGRPHHMMGERPMGAWWKNSEVASKLKLTDQQVQQLESTFYQHRLKLVDLRANIEKQDLAMQQLLDAPTPNDSAIMAQVDQRSAARNQLDREFTQMTLDFRKILTPDQWKQLRTLMPPPGPGMVKRFGHERGGPDGQGPGGPGAPGGVDGPPPPPQGSLP